MSFSVRLVSRAARSPGFSMAGPEVMRMFTPISLAMMPERVVFPSPGGPWRRTWSKGSFRSLAASMNTERFSLAFSWPMYSARRLGRREVSPSSSGRRAEVINGVWLSSWEKSMLIGDLPSVDHVFQGLADDLLQGEGFQVQALQGGGDLRRAIAQHRQGGGGLRGLVLGDHRDAGTAVALLPRG